MKRAFFIACFAVSIALTALGQQSEPKPKTPVRSDDILRRIRETRLQGFCTSSDILISDAMEFLSEESKRLDPQGIGVPIVLKDIPADKKVPRLSLKGNSLLVMLGVITDYTDTRFVVERERVVIVPQNSPYQGNGPDMITTAVKLGDLVKVKEFIASGDDVNATTLYGEPLIHVASARGHIEIIKFLLSKGVSVAAKDDEGSTPLHYAARFGQKAAVEFLLSKGADVNAQDKEETWRNDRFTPLHEAVDAQQNIEWRLQRGERIVMGREEKIDPKHTKAAIRISADIVALLLKRGAKVDARNLWGETPLHRAGNSEIAKLLLAKGAKLEERNDKEETPLHSAVGRGRLDVVRLLLSKGADPNVKDKDGKTPLHKCMWLRRENDSTVVRAIVTELLAKGADVNARDKHGQTPLHATSIISDGKLRDEVVELLKKHGAKE